MKLLVKLKKYIHLYVIGLLLLIGTIFLFSKQDLDKLIPSLFEANFLLVFLAFVFFMVYLFAKSLIFKRVLKLVGFKVGKISSFRVILSSFFVSETLPSQMGSLYRFYVMKSFLGIKVLRSAAAISIDLIVGLMITFSLAATGILVVLSRGFNFQINYVLFVFMFVVMLAFFVLLSINRKVIINFLKVRFKNWVRLQKLVGEIDLSTNKFNRLDLVILGLIDILSAFIATLMLFTLGLSVGELLPFFSLLFVLPLIYILNWLPLTVGGIGITELSLSSILVLFGVSPLVALQIVLLNRAVRILAVLVGGVNLLTIKSVKIKV